MSKMIGSGVGFIHTCRVTGYCASYTRINDAKQDEIKDRTKNSIECRTKLSRVA